MREQTILNENIIMTSLAIMVLCQLASYYNGCGPLNEFACHRLMRDDSEIVEGGWDGVQEKQGFGSFKLRRIHS